MTAMLVAIGSVFMVMAIPLGVFSVLMITGKIPKNDILGVRLKGYQNWSDQKWYRLNRYGGFLFLSTSLFQLVSGLLMTLIGSFFQLSQNNALSVLVLLAFIEITSIILNAVLLMKRARIEPE